MADDSARKRVERSDDDECTDDDVCRKTARTAGEWLVAANRAWDTVRAIPWRDPYAHGVASGYHDLYTSFLGPPVHHTYKASWLDDSARNYSAYRASPRTIQCYDDNADDWREVPLSEAIDTCRLWDDDGERAKPRRRTRGTGADIVIIDEAAHITSLELFYASILPIMHVEPPRSGWDMRNRDDDDDCTDDEGGGGGGGDARKRRRRGKAAAADVPRTIGELARYMAQQLQPQHWYWRSNRIIIGRAGQRDPDTGTVGVQADMPWLTW